ncbi:MAG: glycoside hydrolase family 1 protein [Breznakia sp.]
MSHEYKMNKTYKLPPNFEFGSSSSAWQTEGWAGKKEDQTHFVDMMYKVAPERWHNNIGPKVATDFYHRYEEDIKLMKEIGITIYRTSIDWSRFICNYETNEIDPAGLEFYTRVIDCMIEHGIEPMICLEHWELPEYLIHKYGYWDNREIMNLFVGYSKKVMDCFHDKVKHWMCINEPAAIPSESFMYGNLWPYIEDAKMSIQMNYNRVLATSLLVKYFKEKGYQGKFGSVLNYAPVYPKNPNNGKDVHAARVCDLFNFKQYTDPLVGGAFSKDYLDLLQKHDCMFESEEEDFDIIKENTLIYCGLNYYQPLRVKQRQYAWNPERGFNPEYYYDYDTPRGIKMNISRGWEIHPKGMYDLLMDFKKNYGDAECIITEMGMGVSNEEQFKDEQEVIQDEYRIEFLSEHLVWILKAMEEGVNCIGAMNWTFTDNLSPVNAFKNRYGFVEIDFSQDLKRRIKKSGYWVKEMMKTHSFSAKDTYQKYK